MTLTRKQGLRKFVRATCAAQPRKLAARNTRSQLASEVSGEISLLIVDDHPLVRQTLSALIEREVGLTVCGTAESVETAKAAVSALKPDFVLLDLRMGHGDTLELIKSLRVAYPDMRMLVLSQHEEAIFAVRSIRAGADGYISKRQATNEILTAIRRVLAGEMYVSPEILLGLNENRLPHSSHLDQHLSGLARLSDRELFVFQLFGTGLTARSIADQLKLSIQTVETHRLHIEAKLGITESAVLSEIAVLWSEGFGDSIF